ncbi:nephrin [Plakobranchus ocellatus]|uniref:Nephrin n=1 Tax=Plakobranchus ocellatus TaxID=259542 RepID=A0AAV3ZB50_9GAST|nr:nephrin [Plakobranchus ocellatus]
MSHHPSLCPASMSLSSALLTVLCVFSLGIIEGREISLNTTCPAGCVAEESKPSLCFKVFDEENQKKNYFDARATCRAENAELITRDDLVVARHAKTTSVWSGQFNASYCHVYRMEGNWFKTIPCSQKRPFICKKDLRKAPKLLYFGYISDRDVKCAHLTPLEPDPMYGVKDSMFVSLEGLAMDSSLKFPDDQGCSVIESPDKISTCQSPVGEAAGVYVRQPELCEPLWLPISQKVLHANIGENGNITLAVLFNRRLNILELPQYWYRPPIFKGGRKPELSILEQLSHNPDIYLVKIEATPTTVEDYGEWEVESADPPYSSFEFTIRSRGTSTGPPVFCLGETKSSHVSLPFGSRTVIYVCIMSREPISSRVKKGNIKYTSFSAFSPSPSIRMSISKNSADNMKSTLTVAIHSLSESDIGHWIIYILSEAGQLPYYLHVRAEGPPILCPDESENKTISLPLGCPLTVSICYMSPGDMSQPPAFVRVTKASNDGRKISLMNKQPFETNITKMAGYKMRYIVTITDPAISPEDLGLWKVEVVDPTSGSTSFNFTVLAAGPPECPVGVNVTNQTNHSVTLTWLPGHDGGAPQSFIIFCNTSTDGPLWDRRHVEMPSNSTYGLSVVDGLPPDSNFLFWVEAINKYTDKKGSLVRCDKNAVEARTDPEKSAEISQIAKSSEDGFSLTATVVIVVSVVGALVVIIAVVGFLLYRWRGYANAHSLAQPINAPRNSPVKPQEWGGPVLNMNPVYENIHNVQSQLNSTELPNLGQYVNQGDLSCITVEHSAMGTFSCGDGSKEVQSSSFSA